MNLIVFIMLCGEPDLVLIREVGHPPIAVKWSVLMKPKNRVEFFKIFPKSEKIKIDHTNGLCV